MQINAMRRFVLLPRCSVLVALALAAATALSSSPAPSLLSSDALRQPESPQLQTLTPDHNDHNANGRPLIEVVFPAPHSWWQVDTTTGRLANLLVYFKLHGFQTPDDGFLRVSGEKIQSRVVGQLGTVVVDGNASSFVMNDLEPGSFFFTLELVQYYQSLGSGDSDELLGGERVVASATLHLEVVVPVTSSPMFTYTPVDPDAPPPLRRVTLNSRLERQPSAMRVRSPPQPLPICYILTTKGGFDGQKKMWLQLMEVLSSPQKSADLMRGNDTFTKYPEWAPAFRVEAITFDAIIPDSPVLHALNKLGIQLKGGEQTVRYCCILMVS
jgi:hypothetical protein